MYSVNWSTKVITIPKADTELVSSSPDVRKLSVLTLWETLRSIEDDADGMAYIAIVKNTTPLTVAGVTLGRVVEIINGYTLTFEDGQYAVNIYGGNSNIADVVNKNQVSVNTANSAGFLQVAGGGSVNFDDLMDGEMVENGYSVREALRILLAAMAGKVTHTGSIYRFRDTGDTKDRIVAGVTGNDRTYVTLDPSD